MTLRNFARLAIAGSAFAFLASSALADGIGASLLTQQHPFYIELANAMKSEATAKNVKLEVAIANQDLNKQLADVEDFIVKGVDVIVLSPVDSKGVKAVIEKAEKAGIKVITVDVPANGVAVTSYIGTDNYTGGVKAGELMAKVLGDKGEVAIIDYPTVQSVVNRIDGFKKAIGEHKDIKIVAQQTGITREEQDAFAVQSHRRAIAAIDSGRFDAEIVPVPVPQRKGDPLLVAVDERPRSDTSMEDIIQRADQALYVSKKQGGHRISASAQSWH